MKRVCKIISLCLQYRKYMSVLDQNNSTEIQTVAGKNERVCSGCVQWLATTTHHHRLLWKVRVGFNLQIKNVSGRLKK